MLTFITEEIVMRHAQNLIKALQVLARAEGNRTAAEGLAQSPDVQAMVKSIGSSTASINGDLRVAYREMLGLARRRSLIGKIEAVAGFRTLPFEVPALEQDNAATVAFVAEGQPIPVTAQTFTSRELPRRKLSGIVPITKELAAAMPAEQAFGRELTRAAAQGESSAFYSASAGSPASPAGILAGVTAGTGTTNAADDIASLIDTFTGDLEGAVLLTSPRSGVKLAAVFDGTGARGGEVSGIGHVTSSAIPDDSVAIIEPGRIMLADDGLEIDIAHDATLLTQQGEEIAPYNLWQNNLLAYRVTRWLNWQAAAGSVAYLTGTDW